MFARPSPILLQDEDEDEEQSDPERRAPPRSDIASKDVRNAYPMLPSTRDWEYHRSFVRQRAHYLAANDTIAYEELRSIGINFRPPRIVRLSRRDWLRHFLERTEICSF